jgi:hypothetical protein
MDTCPLGRGKRPRNVVPKRRQHPKVSSHNWRISEGDGKKLEGFFRPPAKLYMCE